MTNKIRDIVCSAVMLVFGAGMLILARDIPHKIASDVGSAYVPTFLAICILVVTGAKLILTLTSKDPSANKKVKSDSDWFGGVGTIALMLVYMAAFQPVGFVISSAVYLFLQMLLLSNEQNRRLPVFGAIAVLLPLAVDALFVFAIQMPLPKGLWGF